LKNLPPDRHIHLGRRGHISADQSHIGQTHIAVLLLGVQIAQQGCAAVVVGQGHDVAGLKCLGEVLALVGLEQIDILQQRVIGRIHIVEDLRLGADYIRAPRAPLLQIPLIASGGVTEQTAGDFILAGPAAVGIGRDLVSIEAIRRRKPEWFVELVRRFLQIVEDARHWEGD
jgi:hypothetical protein